MEEARILDGVGLTPHVYLQERRLYNEDLADVRERIGIWSDSHTMWHLHLSELYLRDNERNDALEEIPRGRQPHFLTALSLQIAFDQAVYTYAPHAYDAFQDRTLYPKVTWSLGYCVNIPPWRLFDPAIVQRRGITLSRVKECFPVYAQHLIAVHKQLLENDWMYVRDGMIDDPDISEGDFGTLFQNELSST